jgi:hypothetical protein
MDNDLERFWGGLGEVCSGSSSATVRDAIRDVGERHIRELQRAREELAELRAERDAVHLIGGMWEQGGGAEPVGYVTTVDGKLVPLRVDAGPVVRDALRRQAKGWVEQHSDGEGPELGALLSLVPATVSLSVGPAPPGVDYDAGHHAVWVTSTGGCEAFAHGLVPAIRAATVRLLECEAAT